jgi:hypothetical protein
MAYTNLLERLGRPKEIISETPTKIATPNLAGECVVIGRDTENPPFFE